MNAILSFLQQRNSAPKLTEPAPSDEQMEEIFRAALRAPDHAWLKPTRFITIGKERREAFGELLESCLVRRQPEADEAARTKARNAPLRAPLLVAVVAHYSEHPKVPLLEQQLSAGCAAYAVLLGAEALGFAGIWRTGASAFDREVMRGLGMAENEEIVGFLYLGTRDGTAKPLPARDTAEFVRAW
ncbi:MAG: nitroreductase family protein [Halioglobus sp.]